MDKNQDSIPYCYPPSEILSKNKLALLRQIFALYGFAFGRFAAVGTLGQTNGLLFFAFRA
ncbi:hypothetical protein M8998_10445 [Sphingobacterium sp. lm-10]|uniref:hypothetical protein n=1 Tax=Sphingobacterium sp. lm-10 TaxID=2944904 RepID=UPI002021B31A|nr:hypothetical protein [Sphingobacterium sp. lm-10]MCL7988357.1 hypothetical protein [Sphingobacterium sp. lm-10]